MANQSQISLRNEFDSKIKDGLGPEISLDNFPDINLEDTPLYKMTDYDNTDVKGDLVGNTEDDEDPDMANGLDR